jgi:hypothetical protein
VRHRLRRPLPRCDWRRGSGCPVVHSRASFDKGSGRRRSSAPTLGSSGHRCFLLLCGDFDGRHENLAGRRSRDDNYASAGRHTREPSTTQGRSRRRQRLWQATGPPDAGSRCLAPGREPHRLPGQLRCVGSNHGRAVIRTNGIVEVEICPLEHASSVGMGLGALRAFDFLATSLTAADASPSVTTAVSSSSVCRLYASSARGVRSSCPDEALSNSNKEPNRLRAAAHN